MPIYEYKCSDCNRRVSLFFPSFSAAESRTAAGENRCPRCEGANLTRLMSRVYSVRSGGSDEDDLMGGDDALLGGLNEDDPREVARWARRMKDNIGEDLDMGPEFDHALARIEAGEDPDKVMQDVDLDALDGGAGEGLDGDFDAEG
jgi:putative FmdB family regulatory protein